MLQKKDVFILMSFKLWGCGRGWRLSLLPSGVRSVPKTNMHIKIKTDALDFVKCRVYCQFHI